MLAHHLVLVARELAEFTTEFAVYAGSLRREDGEPPAELDAELLLGMADTLENAAADLRGLLAQPPCCRDGRCYGRREN